MRTTALHRGDQNGRPLPGWAAPGGREFAEYAFHCGFVFPLLALRAYPTRVFPPAADAQQDPLVLRQDRVWCGLLPAAAPEVTRRLTPTTSPTMGAAGVEGIALAVKPARPNQKRRPVQDTRRSK